MKLLLAIVVLTAVALVGARGISHSHRFPLGVRAVMLTGTVYILLGVLLGGAGIGVLDSGTLSQMSPALLFGLSWVGFLFGLQFKVRQLRSLPRSYFSITALHAMVTFLLVTGAIYLLLDVLLGGRSPALLLTLAMILGSTACCTAQSALAIVDREMRLENRGLLELLRYMSAVDGLFGLCLFALATCLAAGLAGGALQPLGVVWSLAAPALAGLASTAVFIVIANGRFSRQEFGLFIMGSLMFCAGLAHTLHASTLVAGLWFGIAAANVSRHRQRTMAMVIKGEKTIYIILLLLAGASVQLELGSGLLLLGAYLAARAVGKLAGAFVATRTFRPQYPVPPHVGLGLFSEGGLPVAMVMSFRAIAGLPEAETLVMVTLASVLVSELVGPSLILAVFRESGEAKAP